MVPPHACTLGPLDAPQNHDGCSQPVASVHLRVDSFPTTFRAPQSPQAYREGTSGELGGEYLRATGEHQHLLNKTMGGEGGAKFHHIMSHEIR